MKTSMRWGVRDLGRFNLLHKGKLIAIFRTRKRAKQYIDMMRIGKKKYRLDDLNGYE